MFGGQFRSTRDLYLYLMSVVYLFAFGSFYHQIPGLYGDNGVLPAKLVLKPGKSMEASFGSKPTLVWFGPLFDLNVQSMVEFVALLGFVLSFVSLVVTKLRDTLCFAALWTLYMSLYQIGQTFLWFQWDMLLLEAGFLTIFVAPFNLKKWLPITQYHHDKIKMWMVKWLLFRFMFASGVVKLTSMCPTWWQLTALNYHFESQCIPTPLAWYAHQLPEWLLKLGVVGTFFIEIPVPFLFFSPIRSLRMFSFYCQILLQLLIVLSGNYCFFNLLTIVLCVSLLDDSSFAKPPKKAKHIGSKNGIGHSLSCMFTFLTISSFIYWTITLFSLKLTPDFTIESRIAFKQLDFHRVLGKTVQASIYVGAASLVAVVVATLYNISKHVRGVFKKLRAMVVSLFFASIAAWIFCISMIPHTVLDPDLNSQMWPVVQRWHNNFDKYHLVNSYGLFRRMTGVGGRPEVVIEGSDTLNGVWKEYPFLYKPGSLSRMPPVVAPHQPRLDWQMWFAALSSYQQNPWFVSLVNRLLTGQVEVLDLLAENPFPNKPPTYIRATQYIYHYTSNKSKNAANWWTRKKAGEYLPAITKDHKSLIDFLKTHGLSEVEQVKAADPKNNYLFDLLNTVRSWVKQVTAPVFLWSVYAVTVMANCLSVGNKRQ